MSQTVITKAFEALKAQQGADNSPVTLDEFVFANVPDLNITDPIDRDEGVPDTSLIVHREAVTRTGRVNDNAVVYSVVLGAKVGDFEFNWIGLMNKATGTLAMIVHAPAQKKIATTAGQQGNVLTRSFLMEYSGAAEETQINTPAETWQIDFTARMGGMDERQRLENVDIYGPAAFFGDGWLVARTGAQYRVTGGMGYVAGLRAELVQNQDITITTKPVKVWLDVSWQGTLTSVWEVVSKITVAPDQVDYVKGGIQHYVFALAEIDAGGNITDLRPKGSLAEQQGNSDFVRKDKNLSDLKNKLQALNELNGVSRTTTVNGKPLSGNIELDLWKDYGLSMSWAENGALSIYNPKGTSGYGIRFYGSGDLALFRGMRNFWDTGDESAVFYQNGDIKGDRWGGALSSYLGSAARMSYSTADYSNLSGGATEAASTKQLVGLRDRTTPTNRGGTGATTVAVARSNLSVYSKSETDSKYQLKNSASKSQNGQHTDTSTGIIKQWGTFTAGNSISGTVTFPKAFPTNVLVVYFFDVITTNENTATSKNIQWCTVGTTKAKAVWCSNSVNVGYASFLAIGY